MSQPAWLLITIKHNEGRDGLAINAGLFYTLDEGQNFITPMLAKFLADLFLRYARQKKPLAEVIKLGTTIELDAECTAYIAPMVDNPRITRSSQLYKNVYLHIIRKWDKYERLFYSAVYEIRKDPRARCVQVIVKHMMVPIDQIDKPNHLAVVLSNYTKPYLSITAFKLAASQRECDEWATTELIYSYARAIQLNVRPDHQTDEERALVENPNVYNRANVSRAKESLRVWEQLSDTPKARVRCRVAPLKPPTCRRSQRLNGDIVRARSQMIRIDPFKLSSNYVLVGHREGVPVYY